MRSLNELNQANANPTEAERQLIEYVSSPRKEFQDASKQDMLWNIKRMLNKAKDAATWDEADTLIDLALSDLNAI